MVQEKAYGSVDNELLAVGGVHTLRSTKEAYRPLRQSHKDMRARVGRVNLVSSRNGTKFRQGYLLSLLLYSMFFVAGIHAMRRTVVSFSEGVGIHKSRGA